MSSSFTITEARTFTVTHARHIAAKVSTDLKRLQRLYGKPSDTGIAEFETEIIKLLKAGYLGTVTYGYRRSDRWIEPTLRCTAHDLAGAAANDDDPGRIRPDANVDGASFYSYLTYSAAWDKLSETEKDNFKKSLPFYRDGAPALAIDGYLSNDRNYSSGGQALSYTTFRIPI